MNAPNCQELRPFQKLFLPSVKLQRKARVGSRDRLDPFELLCRIDPRIEALQTLASGTRRRSAFLATACGSCRTGGRRKRRVAHWFGAVDYEAFETGVARLKEKDAALALVTLPVFLEGATILPRSRTPT